VSNRPANNDSAALIERLRSLANPENAAGMARFGIKTEHVLGISMGTLRKIARETGKNHVVALELWESGIHEARLLASLINEPEKVTGAQMDKWAEESSSWDICDQCCLNLFARTSFAYDKVMEWSERQEEFVKRAAFSLMACLAVNDKKADDAVFLAFLPVIKREAGDERNYVRKAVNWALRQIGKRNLALNERAIATAREIAAIPSKSARWIAADALRELTGEVVQKRLREKCIRDSSPGA
jgi:3-methyladenine DNA glycosylase AlkD